MSRDPRCIPRREMPQVCDPYLLASRLAALSVPLHFDWYDPAQIRGRQSVIRSKVREMSEEKLRPPIIVSLHQLGSLAEVLIIDGNHRWFYAYYHKLPRLQALVIRLPFEEALERVRECVRHGMV